MGKIRIGKSKEKGVEEFSDFIEKTYKKELEAMGADSDTVQIALNFIVEGKFSETGKNGIESKMDLIFGLIKNSNSFNNLKDEPIFKQLSTLKGVYDTYGDDAINIANSISRLNERLCLKSFESRRRSMPKENIDKRGNHSFMNGFIFRKTNRFSCKTFNSCS